MNSLLFKLVIPVAVSVMVVLLRRRRSTLWKDDLGLRAPVWTRFAGWIVFWVAWMAFDEALIGWWRMAQPGPWKAAPGLETVLKVLTVGVAGPVAEELAMRGLLQQMLSQTRLGTTGAILATAIGWSLIHTSYGLATLVLIAMDGIVLGTARVHSRSLWTSVVMHMMGNLFSIGQSMAA